MPTPELHGIAYAFAQDGRIIAIRSDRRQSHDDDAYGVNLMLSRSAREVVMLELRS